MGLERQYKVCNFGLKAEIHWVVKTKGRSPLVTQAKRRDQLVTQSDLSAPRVCSPAIARLHKKDPATVKRYVRTLSDCIPTTHNRHRRRIEI